MQLRQANIDKLAAQHFDVLVVGAGINGAVCAAALASRGVRVALIDRGDFAGFTSQHSSSLAWGGIKYLEHYEFALVRDLCLSRNELMRSYPSSVREIRFLTTLSQGFRHHRVTLLAGAWAYWLMGNAFTRTPRTLSKGDVEREEPAVRTDAFAGAVEYSDAYLFDNDARFVFNFARTALDRGATVANYVESLSSHRQADTWRTRARDAVSGREFEIGSQVLINATGAFVDEFNAAIGQATQHRHVFSKGVHLMVERVTPNRRVLAFFADDGRPFFVIPMGNRTCIGTTDTRVEEPWTEVTDADRQFILDNINRKLKPEHALHRGDIIAERCGVRPLVVQAGDSATEDFLQLSRRHVIEAHPGRAHASIFGGKLTDCLNVGEEICEHVARMGVALDPPRQRWYGEPQGPMREEYFQRVERMNLDVLTAPHASEPLSQRLWRRHGLNAFDVLELIDGDPAQAEILIEGTEYIRAEIDLTARREMIVTLEDFLRRRSKIALVMSHEEMRAAGGLMEASRILFGEDAQMRYEEYFAPTGEASCGRV